MRNEFSFLSHPEHMDSAANYMAVADIVGPYDPGFGELLSSIAAALVTNKPESAFGILDLYRSGGDYNEVAAQMARSGIENFLRTEASMVDYSKNLFAAEAQGQRIDAHCSNGELFRQSCIVYANWVNRFLGDATIVEAGVQGRDPFHLFAATRAYHRWTSPPSRIEALIRDHIQMPAECGKTLIKSGGFLPVIGLEGPE